MADEEPPSEAEEYFAALDYVIPGLIFCDNCGYPMDKNQTWLHNLSKSRKCSTEMARRIAMGPNDIPADEREWLHQSTKHINFEKQFVETSELPKAFAVKKPSWFERLLQKLR